MGHCNKALWMRWGGLKSRSLSLVGLEAGSPRAQCWQVGFILRSPPLTCRGCGALPGQATGQGVGTPNMRVPPSLPHYLNHPPKTSSPNTIALESRASSYRFWGTQTPRPERAPVAWQAHRANAPTGHEACPLSPAFGRKTNV